MEPVIEKHLNQAARAWQNLTGEPLVAWPVSNPAGPAAGEALHAGVPAGLPELAAALLPAGGRLRFAGQEWLVAGLPGAAPPLALASRAPGLPAEHVFHTLAGLLEEIITQQDTTRQLTDDLLAAWNRLDFLFEIARAAVLSFDLPPIFTQLTRSLLRVVTAQDAFLLLKDGQRLQVFTASGRPLPRPELLAPLAAGSTALLVFEQGDDMPVELAGAFPSANNLVLLPLPLGDESHGLLGLVNHASTAIRQADHQLLLGVAEQIGMLLQSTRVRAIQEASRRLEHELAIASQIQASFVPTALPEAPGMEFAATLRPAFRIGGDFYDVQPVAGGLAIMVGDVAGKGIPAAILAALIHATLKSEAQHHRNPQELLSSINRLIYEELDRSGTFITVFLAVLQLDNSRLCYANAGHPAALLWRTETQEVIQLPSTGFPLGVSPSIEIEAGSIPLCSQDVLVLYSDGITEAENEAGRVFGTQALIDVLTAVHPASAGQQLHMIQAALDLHRGGIPPQDDYVLFLARVGALAGEQVTPFVFTAEKHSVRRLAQQVRRLAGELDFRSPLARSTFQDELELAVSEIAANIVFHAYRHSPYTGRIQGRITTGARRITVDLIDSGAPFPGRLPPIPWTEGWPAHPAPPDHALPGPYPPADPPDHGFGLQIAYHLLDVCQYTLLASGRNHWHLVKAFE